MRIHIYLIILLLLPAIGLAVESPSLEKQREEFNKNADAMKSKYSLEGMDDTTKSLYEGDGVTLTLFELPATDSTAQKSVTGTATFQFRAGVSSIENGHLVMKEVSILLDRRNRQKKVDDGLNVVEYLEVTADRADIWSGELAGLTRASQPKTAEGAQALLPDDLYIELSGKIRITIRDSNQKWTGGENCNLETKVECGRIRLMFSRVPSTDPDSQPGSLMQLDSSEAIAASLVRTDKTGTIDFDANLSAAGFHYMRESKGGLADLTFLFDGPVRMQAKQTVTDPGQMLFKPTNGSVLVTAQKEMRWFTDAGKGASTLICDGPAEIVAYGNPTEKSPSELPRLLDPIRIVCRDHMKFQQIKQMTEIDRVHEANVLLKGGSQIQTPMSVVSFRSDVIIRRYPSEFGNKKGVAINRHKYLMTKDTSYWKWRRDEYAESSYLISNGSFVLDTEIEGAYSAERISLKSTGEPSELHTIGMDIRFHRLEAYGDFDDDGWKLNRFRVENTTGDHPLKMRISSNGNLINVPDGFPIELDYLDPNRIDDYLLKGTRE